MDYIAHHGIKGQKWGVRRYQNPDGTLTDEGRRKYGFGRGRMDIVSKNTASRIKKGARTGAAIGAAYGAAARTVGAVSLAAKLTSLGLVTGVNPVALAGAAAVTALSVGAGGAVLGGTVGAIVGSAETSSGRRYIEKFDKGLDEFEKNDFSKMIDEQSKSRNKR